MNILIEGMTNNMGGKETYIINVFKLLKKLHYRVYFIAYNNQIAYEEDLIEQGAVIIRLPARNEGYWKFCKALDDLFKKNTFDVIWSHKTTLSSCEALSIAKKNKVRIRIIHSHSSANMGGRFTYIMHIINKIRIRYIANRYIACSEEASKWFYGNHDSIILKNAINLSSFKFNKEMREKIREKYSIGNEIVVGHVGRFGLEKNHIKIIEVFAELCKNNQNVKLVLCGDGEQRDCVEQCIFKYGLDEDVILTGVINNVNEILQAFDVFIMPSLFEGLPFVLIEAQAAGLRCVVSDTVSKESDVAGWNTFLPLSADIKTWAKEVKNAARPNDRKKGFELLKSKGFDIADNIKVIEKIIKA